MCETLPDFKQPAFLFLFLLPTESHVSPGGRPRAAVDLVRQREGDRHLLAADKVVIPNIRGGLAATSLFVFIIIWSDFIVALTLTQDDVVTLPVQLSKYSTSSGQLLGPQAAIATIAVIPVMILGIMIQKYLVRGLTFGAVKK